MRGLQDIARCGRFIHEHLDPGRRDVAGEQNAVTGVLDGHHEAIGIVAAFDEYSSGGSIQENGGGTR